MFEVINGLESRNKEEISKNIRKYLPNVEILAVEFSSGEDHLEKCP